MLLLFITRSAPWIHTLLLHQNTTACVCKPYNMAPKEHKVDLVVVGAGMLRYQNRPWAWSPSAKLLRQIGWAGLVNAKTYQLLHPDHTLILLDQNETLGGTVSTFSGRFPFRIIKYLPYMSRLGGIPCTHTQLFMAVIYTQRQGKGLYRLLQQALNSFSRRLT